MHSNGKFYASWFPYEDNSDPNLKSIESEIYFDARKTMVGESVNFTYLGKQGGKHQGKVIESSAVSAHRRDPPCRFFGHCGGCDFQHIDYNFQSKIKQECLTTNLASFILADQTNVLPMQFAKEEFYYRNKMEFTASNRVYSLSNELDSENKKAIGLFVPYSGNKVLEITECLLQSKKANLILAWLSTRAKSFGIDYYNQRTMKGSLRTVLIRSSSHEEVLVMPIFTEFCEKEKLFMQDLQSTLPWIDSTWYLVNSKSNDSYSDLEPIYWQGKLSITETIKGIDFAVGPQTFFQVNKAQTEMLYQIIVDLLKPKKQDTVYDLYCGVGTISAVLATYAKKVVGIEYVDASVELARQNMLSSGISNAVFYSGDIKDLLSEVLFNTEGHPSSMVLDPPRAGLHPKVAERIRDSGVKQLVYVSCKLESLIRDLEILKKNYRLSTLQGVDMMPQTHHIEAVAHLELRPLS